MDIKNFWEAVIRQDAERIRPGRWDGMVERIERSGELITTVTKVVSKEGSLSFHAVSFIKIEDDKIASIDEYWGDDGPAPQWRLDKKIGVPIR